ncbi:KxYKxGKxW signal peptide domain-containing protein [Lactiplantibacillus sp. WILCCON 0030]|uniref:KxYKxGKxW signal peptide domain-containing protein n=1 Tax=Lactiplantibacillus brownii TaxID=3069269 RepID=A0ABU1AB98_9LACO|nr:collagen-binding domain-containing protein [Lactiplantibacillus brownii]MDQ7938244.1 KxYKxGKxW signal peptide domain-containing protein [Lactiplantibacillus brownii]
MESKRTNFKMYKIGRRWAFACAVLLTLGTSTVIANADTAATDTQASDTSSSQTASSSNSKSQLLKSSAAQPTAASDSQSQTVTGDSDASSAKSESSADSTTATTSATATQEKTQSTTKNQATEPSSSDGDESTVTNDDLADQTSSTDQSTSETTDQNTNTTESAATDQTTTETSATPTKVQATRASLTKSAVTPTANDAVKDGGTVEDDYPDLHNILGISSQFHIFAREADLGTHTNGNVAVGNLIGNVNFGTNIIEELLDKDISYIQNVTNIASSSFVSAGDTRVNKVIFGEDVAIDISNPKRPKINGVDIDHLLAEEVYQDKNGNVYIDFDKEFAKLEKLSASLSEQTPVKSYTNSDFEDMNKRVIDVSDLQPDKDGRIVINLTADVLAGNTPLTISGLSADKDGNTVIINVDTEGATDYNVNSAIKIIYDDGSERNSHETEYFGDNHLLWNFYDSTASDKQVTGKVDFNAVFQGSVLAPAAEVTANQNLDGNIIADKVNVRGETHRWDLQDNVDNETDPDEPALEPDPDEGDYDIPGKPGIDVDMPGTDTPGKPGIDVDMPGTDTPGKPGIDVDMPGTDTPGKPGIDVDMPGTDTPGKPGIDAELPGTDTPGEPGIDAELPAVDEDGDTIDEPDVDDSEEANEIEEIDEIEAEPGTEAEEEALEEIFEETLDDSNRDQVKVDDVLLTKIDEAIKVAQAKGDTALVQRLEALKARVEAAVKVAKGERLPQTDEQPNSLAALLGLILAGGLTLGAVGSRRRKHQN